MRRLSAIVASAIIAFGVSAFAAPEKPSLIRSKLVRTSRFKANTKGRSATRQSSVLTSSHWAKASSMLCCFKRVCPAVPKTQLGTARRR